MPQKSGSRPTAEHQMLKANQTLNAFLGPRRLPKPRTAPEQPRELEQQVPESTTAVQEGDGTQHLQAQPTAEGPLSDPGQPPPSPAGATTQAAETAATMIPSSFQQPSETASRPVNRPGQQEPVGQRPQFTRGATGSLLQTQQPQSTSTTASRPQPSRTPSLPHPTSAHSSTSESPHSTSVFALRPDPATKPPGPTLGTSPHVNRSATNPSLDPQVIGTSLSASLPSHNPAPTSTRRGGNVADHASRTTITASLPSPTPTDEPSPAALGYIGSPQPASIRMDAQAVQPGANMGGSGASTPQTQIESLIIQQAANALALSAQAHTAENATPAGLGLIDNSNPQDSSMATWQPPSAEEDDPFNLPNMQRVLMEKRNSFDLASLQHPVTRPRLGFLQRAVEGGDLFYVLLHQLFCAWSASRQLIYPLLSISPAHTDRAFEIMQYALRDNRSMPQEHLGWFASFPCNSRGALQNKEPGKSLTKHISAFLLQMSEQWTTFVQSLNIRGYPIFVWELESLFRLKSPTLQGILFTVCRRTMGILDGDAARSLQELFNEDRRSTNAGLSVGQRQEIQSKLLMSYSQIVAAYRSAMAQQGQQQANTPPLPQSQWQQQQQQLQSQMQQHQQQQDSFQLQQQHHQQQQQQQHQHRQNIQLQQPQQYLQQMHMQQQQQQQQQAQQQRMLQQSNQAQGHPQLPPLQYPLLQHQPQGFRPTSSQSSQHSQQSRPGSTNRGPHVQQGPFQTPPILLSQSSQRHPQQYGSPNQQVHSPLYGPGVPIPTQAFMGQQGVSLPQQSMQTGPMPQPLAGNLQHPHAQAGNLAHRQPQHSPALPSPGIHQSPVTLPVPSPSQEASPIGAIQQPAASQHAVASNINPTHASSGVVPSVQPSATVAQHVQESQQQGSPLVAASGPSFQGRNGISEVASVANSIHQVSVPSLNARQETNPAQPGPAPHPPQAILNTDVNPSAFSFHHSPGPITAASPGANGRPLPQLPYQIQRPITDPRVLTRPPAMPSRVAPGRALPAQPAASARVEGALVPAPNQIITIDRYPQSPFDPRSTEMALHQVHARSPRRVPVPLPGSSSPTVGQYHQAVRAILVGPSSVGTASRNMKLNFDVPVDILLRLSKAVHPMGAYQATVGYFEGALRYRFRMCAIPASKAKSVSEHTWVTTATNWPEHVFVTFNDTAVPIRRKSHHGASQPVELTPLLRMGQNSLHISVLQPPKAKNNVVYFAAVELVETRGTESIKGHIFEQCTVPASVTSKLVAERLKPAEGGDELMIMDNTVSIDLNDPFTMSMFKTPVRGVECTHLECFDLDTWLATRTGKPLCHHKGRQMCETCRSFESLGPEPTYTDGWKCPICSSDARPRSLRVDMFLCHVREQLIAQGKGGTKSISVNPDGSWTPRIEEDQANDSDGEDGPSAKRRRSDAPDKERGPGPGIEVIELD